MKYASLKKVGGKWQAIIPGQSPTECKSVDEANDIVEKYNAEQEAKANAPIVVSVTKRGAISVNGSDKDVVGRFPLLTLSGKQFKLLSAHWPEITAFFAANESQIVPRWQDFKKVDKDSAEA